MKFVAAIHGILTRRTDPAWPWLLQAHAVRGRLPMVVQAEHYWAGPFPRLNTWFVNPRLARAFAKRLALLGNDGGPDDVPVSVVGHSNGANIAVDLAWELRDRGQPVDELVLVAGAVECDVAESGLLELVDCGAVGRVVAYCSQHDKVVRPLELFRGGYGSLGACGLTLRGEPVGEHVDADDGGAADGGAFVTRWFPRYGHSDYFEDGRAGHTFGLLAEDLGLEGLAGPVPRRMRYRPDDFEMGCV